MAIKLKQVLEIRRKYAAGIATQVQLAEEFDVSRRAVRAILSRETWTHI